MKTFLITLTVLVWISCNSKTNSVIDSKKESELKTYFNSVYHDIDSTVTTDTFRFIRFDTITFKEKLLSIASNLSDEIDELQTEAAQYNMKAREELHSMRVFNGILPSAYANAKEDFNKYSDKAKELVDEAQVLIDKQKKYLDSSVHADSTKAEGFQAICLYQIRRKDQSVKKDTAFITMNKEMNIVEKKDFYKE